MPSNVFSSNSRYLPPPIRTHYCTHQGNDLERAATFLNQDWFSQNNAAIPHPLSPPSLDRYRLSTRAVFPPPPCSDSSDDCTDGLDIESDSDGLVKREHFSPAFSTRTSISPPSPSRTHLFKSDSVANRPPCDQISLLSQEHTQRRKSISIHTRKARCTTSSSHGPDSRSATRSQERMWPPALHPSQSSAPTSPTLPPITTLNPNRLSRNSSTPTPPPTTPSPHLPPTIVKSEPSAPSIPYANNNTRDVDDYIEKTGASRSMCVWRLDGAGEQGVCGFESSGSLVKRHIRTVHLKIRPVTCPVCNQGFSTKFHLKTHANIHTGLKPYSCPDCGKTFSNPSSKHHHRVRYHGYVQTWRHYGDKDKSAR
jgi:hypothetical protein